MKRILLVDDSPDIRNFITVSLRPWYRLDCAETLAEATKLLGGDAFDLILLDVNLPDGDGFAYCANLKNDARLKDLPVIFLTGRSDPSDKMIGFSVGAEDYVVKPAELIELRARIEARLRRNTEAKDLDRRVGPFRFDQVRNRAFETAQPPEKDLGLTPFEFRLLYFLASHPETYFDRKALLARLTEPGVHIQEETLYTHVSSLRKKLGAHADCIQSSRGVGYCFTLKK